MDLQINKTMNWGKAIILVFIAFTGFIGTMVVQMSREKIDLVRDDYYQDEIAYQQHIEKVSNARQLDASTFIQYQAENEQVQLTLPANLTTGTLLLYCPANRRQDVRRTLTKTTPAVSLVPMQGRPTGVWRAQLSWSDGQRDYYTERELMLP